MQSKFTQPGRYTGNTVFQGSRPSFTTTSDAYAQGLYASTVEGPDVDTFLQANYVYDTTERKWAFPTVSGTTEQLIGAVYNVLRSIVGRFVQPGETGVEREVRNTLNIPACEEKNEDDFRVCPVLLVRASGPSFQIPESLVSISPVSSSIGFSNMATYFSVKFESDFGTEKENLDEMASYARRIFHEQPNRIFVRSLIITEKHARLVHFDRAGSQITPPIDLHQHPATFIRLVAGLSSTSERVLGLDDSFRWTIVDGRKTKGTLTTTGPSGQPTTYPIVGLMETIRDSIRGRATTCWRVEDPETYEEYIVKDSWRPDDRTAEHAFLELVKGIPGIVQMISHEDGRVETKAFRCPSTTGQYHNRIFARVTMKSYGKSLMFFQSVLQLLCAVRDAIAAHQKLVGDDIRVLHRDISHNNILLGKEGAPEGERGVIIDFDMAFQATDDVPMVTVEHNVGTRLFQSLHVVGSSYLRKNHPAHDYLDDLESFLYLITYVFLLHRPDRSRFPGKELGPSIVRTWAEENPKSAYTSKRKLYGAGAIADSALRFIDEHWGSTCSTLFDGFSWWILDRRGEKSDLLIGPNSTGAPDALEPLLARRDEHYEEVLKMFDEAIEALGESASGGTNTPRPVSPTCEAPTGGKADPPVPQGVLGSTHPPSSVPPVVLSTPPARHPFPTASSLQDVEMGLPMAPTTPTHLPTPPTPLVVTQPRHSARIRGLQLAKSGNEPPSFNQVLPPRKNPPLIATSIIPQPRRSDRIRKRQLEDDEPSQVPPSEARRVKKRLRVTTRSR